MTFSLYGLRDFEVRRYTKGVDEVRSGAMFGVDGRMLDLTATGERVIANPSAEMPRESATPNCVRCGPAAGR